MLQHVVGRDLATLLALPVAEVGPVFAEPWQARAFALVLALSEGGHFTLKEFQRALIARISAYEKNQCVAGSADYYTRWIEALFDLINRVHRLPDERLHHLEHDVVDDAESRKAHQRLSSRNLDGSLKIAPIVVDAGTAAPSP